MKKQNKKAFTLVELIVVITILAILWTIAFISLQGYSSQARDSKRISDISNIKKSLELFSLSTWKYPEPDNLWKATYSWVTLWKQWTIWNNVSINLSKTLNKKPSDPLTQREYIYSVTDAQREYELLSVYENDLVWYNNILNQTQAEEQDYPKIDGTYNWVYIKTPEFYFATPSIINAEINLNEDKIIDSNNIESQIITWEENLLWTSTWWIDNLKISTYNKILTSKSSDEEKQWFIQALQTAYTWTILANQWVYLKIMETPLDKMDELVDNFIGESEFIVNIWDNDNNDNIIVVVDNTDYTNCNTILTSWWSAWDWIYTIDPENNWTWFDVYCDMTTDWGWWTLVAYSKWWETTSDV